MDIMRGGPSHAETWCGRPVAAATALQARRSESIPCQTRLHPAVRSLNMRSPCAHPIFATAPDQHMRTA